MSDVYLDEEEFDALQKAWQDRFVKIGSKATKKNGGDLVRALATNNELKTLFKVGARMKFF